MVYIHNGILFSLIKNRNSNIYRKAHAIELSKITQTQKVNYHIFSHMQILDFSLFTHTGGGEGLLERGQSKTEIPRRRQVRECKLQKQKEAN